jgi:hypothetical protein
MSILKISTETKNNLVSTVRIISTGFKSCLTDREISISIGLHCRDPQAYKNYTIWHSWPFCDLQISVVVWHGHEYQLWGCVVNIVKFPFFTVLMLWYKYFALWLFMVVSWMLSNFRCHKVRFITHTLHCYEASLGICVVALYAGGRHA